MQLLANIIEFYEILLLFFPLSYYFIDVYLEVPINQINNYHINHITRERQLSSFTTSFTIFS